MELVNGKKSIKAKSRTVWRKWLEKNHLNTQAVFLIIYRKKCEVPSVYYPEAVEEALCFGWIDSVPKKRDENSFYLMFSKRNPKSNWSVLNKSRVKKLMEQGLMTPAGIRMVELAKASGTWIALDKVHNLEIPEDLQEQLHKNKKALKNFEAFSPSSKRAILDWVYSAKRMETREKRVKEIVRLAAQNQKANQYQPSKKT